MEQDAEIPLFFEGFSDVQFQDLLAEVSQVQAESNPQQLCPTPRLNAVSNTGWLPMPSLLHASSFPSEGLLLYNIPLTIGFDPVLDNSNNIFSPYGHSQMEVLNLGPPSRQRFHPYNPSFSQCQRQHCNLPLPDNLPQFVGSSFDLSSVMASEMGSFSHSLSSLSPPNIYSHPSLPVVSSKPWSGPFSPVVQTSQTRIRMDSLDFFDYCRSLNIDPNPAIYNYKGTTNCTFEIYVNWKCARDILVKTMGYKGGLRLSRYSILYRGNRMETLRTIINKHLKWNLTSFEEKA
ncbi:hypothetical protein GYMLUDRAFT_58524 [Collybiopsis luxurians FD-317 M1]|uniref:Uncharacterized protein n=1 Tax=Collybiopsis luxurians FD-317 M1 TaxID=944289 RepID=A0A0D0CRL9_9AGAR|nr:hypothetical protein GYMLUDRAFT_58524 [Collybiopsis luxurians FD-317 M1]